MDFALFYEIPVPQPWGPDSDHVAYKNTIEQAVHGEQAGFSSFWTVEHHFLDEYSHCSAPDALYGAIAAQTTTMRIGHGVRLLPYPYNHPVRAAEAAAVVDLVSDGRLEFGTGRSSTRAELEGFGADPEPHPRAVGRGPAPRRRGVDQRHLRGRRPHLEGPAAAAPPEAAPATAPAALGRVDQPRQPRHRRRARARAAVVHDRRPARGARRAHQDLPRRPDPGHEPDRQVHQQPRRHVHDGALRRHRRAGVRGGRGVLRVVRAHRAVAHRHRRRMAGRQAARHLRLRRGHQRPRPVTCSPSTTCSRRAPASSADPSAASRSPGATTPPTATCCSACSTRTRSRTSR